MADPPVARPHHAAGRPRPRQPRRLRLRAGARADVPRRRRPRGRHPRRGRRATTSTRPSTTPSWRRSSTPSSPASRSTCWRPWPSAWPTSASPTRWSTPSRSPCTSRRPSSGCPSTTSPSPSAGERRSDAGGAVAGREPRRPGRRDPGGDHGPEGRRPGRPVDPLRDPAVGAGRAAAVPERGRRGRAVRGTPTGGWSGRTSSSRPPAAPASSAGGRAPSTSTSSRSPRTTGRRCSPTTRG